MNRVMLAVYERQAPAAPWITRQACEFLAGWLKPHHVGVEWGSGRSTLWFARRVARLTSVEHDTAWYENVRAQLELQGISNVDYYLAPIDGAQPAAYVDAGRGAAQSLDFALVDGKLRDDCTRVAMERLRRGGLLVIDNAEQFIAHPSYSPSALQRTKAAVSPAWQQLARDLSGWTCTWTSNGVCDTAIYTKPAC
jgi:predicted O-methyltransferase YrrM